MPEKEREILEEVDFLRDRYFTFDDPIPFCGMYLYPVPTRNYNEFLSSSYCLTLNKNDDFAGLKKTHLEYLLDKMRDEKDGPVLSFKFSKLVELVFHITNGMKCNKCKKTITFDEFVKKINSLPENAGQTEILACPEDGCDGQLTEIIKYKQDEQTKKMSMFIDGHEITSDDFDKFRKFVMYQNLPDYKDDSWVEKSIRDDQALKQELQSKDSGTATLERKILCVCSQTSMTPDQIEKMSMRKFIMLLGIIQDAMEYQINKMGLMSGFVSLKKGEKIEHWIYKRERGLYDAAVGSDELAKKISGA